MRGFLFSKNQDGLKTDIKKLRKSSFFSVSIYLQKLTVIEQRETAFEKWNALKKKCHEFWKSTKNSVSRAKVGYWEKKHFAETFRTMSKRFLLWKYRNIRHKCPQLLLKNGSRRIGTRHLSATETRWQPVHTFYTTSKLFCCTVCERQGQFREKDKDSKYRIESSLLGKNFPRKTLKNKFETLNGLELNLCCCIVMLWCACWNGDEGKKTSKPEWNSTLDISTN